MRIVFFGSPTAALPSFRTLLEAGHSIELVITQPDKPAGRGRKVTASPVKSCALGLGIPVIEPLRIRTDEKALERARAARPDVNVVVAYGQIIPHDLHHFPRFHSLNVHFSLLPKYRGAAPVQWTVLNGDVESGVTIIELDDRMDEGDILAQEKVAVGPRESAPALETRLAALGAGLLVSTLARIGDIPHLNQDDTQATLAPKIRKEDGHLSWADAAGAIDRKVLALAERPGVFTFFGGKRLGLFRGRALGPKEISQASGPASPGTVLGSGRAGLVVACGGGTAYLIEELQPEGKAAMSAHAFSLGTKIAPSDILGI
jgi:methionyl-tRNA formyltransferase